MNISRINLSSYNSRVSFGEIEGEYEPFDPYPPRNTYELRQREINNRFDLKRKQLFNTCFDRDEYSEIADRIETVRRNALEALDETCRKCLRQKKLSKLNPLRLFGLK